MKYSFRNDYSELAHPRVLEALTEQGTKQFEGYGLDECSAEAARMLADLIGKPEAEAHFIAGGTHANQVVTASLLRPYEAVIACASGHIAMHEAGAIEATGHKVCATAGEDGKISAVEIESIVLQHEDEHMVKPRLVYISQSAETGTVYTKAQLTSISHSCRRNGLYLFIDGARLGAAVCSAACDAGYSDIAELADVFYIGGTKNGALFGEAIVLTGRTPMPDFRYHLKQRGAMLAKGAAIAIQFRELFRDGLYDELAARANSTAMMLAKGIEALGYSFSYPVQTNQIFPVFPVSAAEKLHSLYGFYDWEQRGDSTAVRLITSWATPAAAVEEFLYDLAAL